MARHVVGKVSDIPDGGRLFVELQGHSIGVFHVHGRYYAVLNHCPHMGAELCRGSILGRLDSTIPGEFSYDASRSLLRCPWHGWEYDLETGQSYFDSRARAYPVDVEGGGELAREVEEGTTVQIDEANRAQAALGLPSARLQPGPYVAQTFPIEIDDEYIVVTLPGRRTRR